MKAIVLKVKRILKQIAGLLPSALPNGVAAFEAWASDIEQTYQLPTADKDSIRFALASVVMHLGPQTAYKSKLYFALTLKAGAAKQVAGQTFHDIKERQKAAEIEAQKNLAANGPQK